MKTIILNAEIAHYINAKNVLKIREVNIMHLIAPFQDRNGNTMYHIANEAAVVAEPFIQRIEAKNGKSIYCGSYAYNIHFQIGDLIVYADITDGSRDKWGYFCTQEKACITILDENNNPLKGEYIPSKHKDCRDVFTKFFDALK